MLWKNKNQIWIGALLGAAAAVIVALTGHLLLWMNSGGGYGSTGATQGVDLWTYYGMARAVWRSPNGITYSYPYELNLPTPAVLFQLPITVLAWIGRVTGLPAAFEIARVAGAAGAGAAVGAIGALFPRGFWRKWFYIAAVTGGGLFSLAAIKMALESAGLPGLTEPHQYMPEAMGRLFWWLPWLAPNLRMPLECIYHALVIGGLAALAWRRYWTAWALGAAVWMSNPFAAIALHSAAVPWLLWRMIETRGAARRKFAAHLIAWLAVNAVAALYYGWFLNRWPLFRELGRLYRIQYVPALDWRQLALLTMPYGAALIATVFSRTLRRAIWGRPAWRLFALLAVAHVALIQQSAVLGEHSMQAYHYNRGYLHLGLVVTFWRAAVVLLHRSQCLRAGGGRLAWWPWRFRNIRCRCAANFLCAVVIMTCLDQAFFALYAIGKPGSEGLIDSNFAAVVRAIPEGESPAVVLAERGWPGSYVAAFSPHVAYRAEETMVVPFEVERRANLEREMSVGGDVAGLGVDYVIVNVENAKWFGALRSQGWVIVGGAERLVLFGR